MAITHQEIADRAGVSRALVTRALHRTHGARVSAQTRREILKVARQLGYQPRNFTTHNIGYVGRLEALPLAGESRFLLFVDRALRRAGFHMVLTSLDDDRDSPTQIGEVLNSKTVDGVIFTRWFGGHIHNLVPPQIPWLVLTDEDAVPRHVDKVTMDSAQIAEAVTEHLIRLGHQRIGIVTSPSIGSVTTHLHIGVRNALAKAGIPQMVPCIEVVSDREIAQPLRELLRSAQAPTAFLTFGAEKAVTVLNLLHHFGYRVPQDFSLVSLIDSHMLEPLKPAISATTALDSATAERVVLRLLEKIENPRSEPQHILVPGELVLRQSIGPVKATKNSGRAKL
jgi:LacI family repressor for deo operon, udp, cdd, tsx, nupC, and nupG